ncbi:MAG: polymer-forming cytoskeletal protein [Proteobacteria bacterium]|jgi:cytoskeletal protein CcmA (bactofilin family)|nr:polymer-forming cytoskeletal protein [Pseudomonadota bacterium]MDA1135618.1 polymer-forming cytoskeletal protein [Pseudomonadota bacterium]
MLGKTNNADAVKSIISSDMKIKGKISAEGELLLLGSVTGDIKCYSLSVDETGTLKGNVEAEIVTVSGTCEGQVTADVVSVKSSGKIKGEIFYENISIEEGAIVEAQLGKKKK